MRNQAVRSRRWKTALPGGGHSTPVIWGDRLFLTTAVPYGEALKPRYSKTAGAHDDLPVTHHHKFVVLAISRRTGKILWQKIVHQELPHAVPITLTHNEAARELRVWTK